MHGRGAGAQYARALSADWQSAPDGVDVIQDRALIDAHFPTFAKDIATILHIRRAGDISGQQMGSIMLQTLRERGGLVVPGRVVDVVRDKRFALTVQDQEGVGSVTADILVNAAGPYVGQIAGLIGESLPVSNVFQQKIAFEDTKAVINRHMPFSIDLDAQTIDWTDQERELLADDPDTAWLAKPMPGAIHCRPEGGDHGTWLKLGWAFNTTPSEPSDELPYRQTFPEIVLRGASRLNPGLKAYYGHLPSRLSHYGGYYTMTRENWPLIGPMTTHGAFVAGALSGFGTMAACATGALIAKWVCGETLPDFALALSHKRYGDETLMKTLLESGNTGVL